MTVSDTFVALVLIGLLLVLGKILRRTIPLFERIYLPTSIIAGGLALLVGPQVMGDGLIPEHPYERGLGDFGQSMGMTVTGLLLMRIADPANRSGGLEAFGYKQLMFEPVVGGGLFTAASIPLIAQLGPWWVLALTATLLVFWVVVGMRGFERTG